MKGIIKIIRSAVNNNYVKLLMSFILLVIGVKEIWEDITSGELNFNENHSFGIYGLFLFIDSLFSIMEGIAGIAEGKGLFVKKKD